MGSRGLKINMDKTKMLVSCSSEELAVKSGIIPVQRVTVEWE